MRVTGVKTCALPILGEHDIAADIDIIRYCDPQCWIIEIPQTGKLK
jgi:hypothetical protein